MLKNIYHVGEAVLGRVLDKSTRVQVLEKKDKYKYKYWIFKGTWIQVQVVWKLLEYKYQVLRL